MALGRNHLRETYQSVLLLAGKKYKYDDVYFRASLSFTAALFLTARSLGIPKNLMALYEQSALYFIISLSICLISTEYINRMTLFLDKKCSWKDRTYTRACMQLLLGNCIPFLIVFQLDRLFYKIYHHDMAFPFMGLYLLFVNLYYLCSYLILAYNEVPLTEVQYKKSLLVSQGMANKPLPIDQISHIKRDGDNVYIVTFDEEAYLIGSTLDELQQNLNPEQFFRANRKYIVNYNACLHFKPGEHRKLELIISPKTPFPITISQQKVKAFKEWIER